jgi:uncharacterized protein (DUF4415 family)
VILLPKPKLPEYAKSALERAQESVRIQAEALEDLRPAYEKMHRGDAMNKQDVRRVVTHLRIDPDEIERLRSGPKFSQEHMDFLFKTPHAFFYFEDEDSGKRFRVDVVHGEEPVFVSEDDPDFE